MLPFVVTRQHVEKFNAGEDLCKALLLDSPGLLCWGGVWASPAKRKPRTLVTLHFSSGLGGNSILPEDRLVAQDRAVYSNCCPHKCDVDKQNNTIGDECWCVGYIQL